MKKNDQEIEKLNNQASLEIDDYLKEPENGSPKIIGFLCNWCSYAGADYTGSLRKNYPPNIKIVRIPCSARVNPLFIIKALAGGIDGVLVSGCHMGDCHYSEGNYYARRRLFLLKKLLPLAGIDPKRFRSEWISASEGREFAYVIKAFKEELENMPKNTALLGNSNGNS